MYTAGILTHTPIYGHAHTSIDVLTHPCMYMWIGSLTHTHTLTDVADGNMRAILSLFYYLSQFKKSVSKSGLTSSDSTHTSRIARPVSPGLKTTHGVANGRPHTSHPHTTHTPLLTPPTLTPSHHPHSHAPTTHAPLLTGSVPSPTLTKSSTLPALPTTVVTNGNTPSPAIGRRTAGSSILTTTTYDRPYSQRRVPYKSMGSGDLSERSLSEEGVCVCVCVCISCFCRTPKVYCVSWQNMLKR